MTGSLSTPGGGHSSAQSASVGGGVGGVGGVGSHHQQQQQQQQQQQHQQQQQQRKAHRHQHQQLQQQLQQQRGQHLHQHQQHHHHGGMMHHRLVSAANATAFGKQQQQLQLLQKRPDKHTVHWFRKGLRLHDNPSFVRGVRDSATFRCVFIIDPWFAGASNVGVNKWRFLLQCLEDLDRSLKKFNSRLFVIRGQPADTLPKLFKKWGTTCLSFEEDPEPFGRVRDQNIQKLCAEAGVQVIKCVSHTLFQLDNIIERNGGTAPLTYTHFQDVVASLADPDAAEPAVSAALLATSQTPTSEDHDDKYGVPTMQELGFDTDALPPAVWLGGETEALRRLERHLERKAWVATFGKPKMTPQSLLACQTGLSPYFRFGCLSTRLFYHQLTELYRRVKQSRPPLALHGQLLWREFFFCSATRNANFDRMERNEVCVQIPWQTDATALAKWSHGQTGFPWIDAIMVQLRREGWIHHLARHAVACFLTRGDLWISWVEGMKVFEELLLDADWSVNAGMWMWLSGSSFFQQFFHCYCPVTFGRKVDPSGDFIRRYLPVLENMPTQFVHEPWNAPEEVQRAAKCVVGRDYPLPMVNHVSASRTNLRRLKQVYHQLDKYRGDEEDGADDEPVDSQLQQLQQQQHHNITVNISTPSPNSITRSLNYSGRLMCTSADDDRRLQVTANNEANNVYQQQVAVDVAAAAAVVASAEAGDYVMQNLHHEQPSAQQQTLQTEHMYGRASALMATSYAQSTHFEAQQHQMIGYPSVECAPEDTHRHIQGGYHLQTPDVSDGGVDKLCGSGSPAANRDANDGGDIAAQQELNQYLNEDQTPGQSQLFENCLRFMQSNDDEDDAGQPHDCMQQDGDNSGGQQ